MGISVSVKTCNTLSFYNKLTEKFGDFTTYYNFRKDLDKFGEIYYDKFFILENELYEDCDSFSNLFIYLNDKYGLEDCFSCDIYLLFNEMKGNVSLDEVYEI